MQATSIKNQKKSLVGTVNRAVAWVDFSVPTDVTRDRDLIGRLESDCMYTRTSYTGLWYCL